MLNNNADSQVRMHIALREQFEKHCLNNKRTQGGKKIDLPSIEVTTRHDMRLFFLMGMTPAGKKKKPPQCRGHDTS